MFCQGKILSITIDQKRYQSISRDIVRFSGSKASILHTLSGELVGKFSIPCFTSENYVLLYEEKPQSFEWWKIASNLKG